MVSSPLRRRSPPLKTGPNSACPCGSGSKFKRCCRKILKGANASSPEQLMRSRYTAYATGDINHIMRSTHPDSPHREIDEERWKQDLSDFVSRSSFTGLRVLAASSNGDTGQVTFEADLMQNGQPSQLKEASTFLREAGRWMYHSGEAPRSAKAGFNA